MMRYSPWILAALFAASVAYADEKPPITLSGSGKGPVEVRNSSGQVTEVISQKNLILNQIPPEAVAREEAYRSDQIERARELDARHTAEQVEKAARDAEAAAVAEEAAADEINKAIEAEEDFNHTPMKVRRKTVRGTRYIAEEPVDSSLRTPGNTGVKQVWPPRTPPSPDPRSGLPMYNDNLPTYNPNPK